MSLITLDRLAPGSCAVLRALKNEDLMRRRLQELGFVCGTKLQCLGRSPGGDPSAYLVRGTVIALRQEDCREILVEEFAKGESPWD
ncbi:MAG: ferrous iron transport protein A [Clostridia bacterium]|nr:ferrous iron transport protein A [Clostridia bacterium]